MVPDTRLRLTTVVKALDDIITPALPAEAVFAHEQLALIKKSISIAIEQIVHEYAFTVRDAKEYLALAEALTSHMADNHPVRPKLADTRERGHRIVPETIPDRPAVEAYLHSLKSDVEVAVEVLFTDTKGKDMRAVEALILDHGAGQTLRERAWTISTGFEKDPASIPPVTDLIYGVSTGPTQSASSARSSTPSR